MGPLMQQLQALPARSRQGLNNLRQRIFQQGMFFPLGLRPSHLPWSSYPDILTLLKRRETTQGNQPATHFPQCSPSCLDHCCRRSVHQHGGCVPYDAISETCGSVEVPVQSVTATYLTRLFSTTSLYNPSIYFHYSSYTYPFYPSSPCIYRQQLCLIDIYVRLKYFRFQFGYFFLLSGRSLTS